MSSGSEVRRITGPGRLLALWAGLIVLIGVVNWVTGLRTSALQAAVEDGAARVEARTKGEASEDAIRQAIRSQRETLRFWETLAWIDDFVIEPAAPALRAFAVTLAMASLAMLVGRPHRYAESLLENGQAQVWWVLGLAVTTGLAVALRRSDVDTSAALLLPPGSHPATLWAGLRQLDAFAAIGWGALAWGAWRRGQANLVAATLVVLGLWAAEAAFRVAGSLVLGAGMRLTLIPEL